MAAAGYVLTSPQRLALFERLGARIARPLSRGREDSAGCPARWAAGPRPEMRPCRAARSFREWWRLEHGGIAGPRAVTEPEGPEVGSDWSSWGVIGRGVGSLVATTLTTLATFTKLRRRRTPAKAGHDRPPRDDADQRAEVLGAIRGAVQFRTPPAVLGMIRGAGRPTCCWPAPAVR